MPFQNDKSSRILSLHCKTGQNERNWQAFLNVQSSYCKMHHRLYRWDERAKGPATRDKILGQLRKEGYNYTTYTFGPGTVFGDHSHGCDKKDSIISGKFFFRMGGEEVGSTATHDSHRHTSGSYQSSGYGSQRAQLQTIPDLSEVWDWYQSIATTSPYETRAMTNTPATWQICSGRSVSTEYIGFWSPLLRRGSSELDQSFVVQAAFWVSSLQSSCNQHMSQSLTNFLGSKACISLCRWFWKLATCLLSPKAKLITQKW